MQTRTTRRGVRLTALATALGLLICCNDSSGSSTGGSTTVPTTSSSGGGGSELNGAGATFPAPLYQQWFTEYKQAKGIQINYQPIGSSGGIKSITVKSVDFGASDAPVSDDELKAAPSILHVPTVAGAVCVAYNVPGAPPNLKLNGDVIANMFLGKITAWNDPAIVKLNPGVTLPATKLTPFHREDGSGTTNIFTTYLSAVSPSWKRSVGAGKSVKWPVGLGPKGSTGFAQIIQQNAGGVGYIELAYAVKNKIPFASVQNSSGNFITPSVESTTAAVGGVTMPADFRIVPVNTTAPQGYPITGFTFLLVYPDAKPAVKDFLIWAMTTGQKDAPALLYAPLPDAVQKQALAEVATIQ
jgi:phosphate transport system substrate-binding protein